MIYNVEPGRRVEISVVSCGKTVQHCWKNHEQSCCCAHARRSESLALWCRQDEGPFASRHELRINAVSVFRCLKVSNQAVAFESRPLRSPYGNIMSRAAADVGRISDIARATPWPS